MLLRVLGAYPLCWHAPCPPATLVPYVSPLQAPYPQRNVQPTYQSRHARSPVGSAPALHQTNVVRALQGERVVPGQRGPVGHIGPV